MNQSRDPQSIRTRTAFNKSFPQLVTATESLFQLYTANDTLVPARLRLSSLAQCIYVHDLQEVVVPQKRHLEEVVDLRSGLKGEEPHRERMECKCLVQRASKHGTWRAEMKCVRDVCTQSCAMTVHVKKCGVR